MRREEIEATVRGATEEVWNLGQPDRVGDFYSAEHVRHDASLPEDLIGLEALQGHVEGQRRAFPDGRLELNEILVEGDRFALRWNFSGTHQGGFAGIPPTGRKVTMGGLSVGRVADGKIAEVWESGDLLAVLRQLGVMRPPAAS